MMYSAGQLPFYFARPLLCCCARRTVSSGDGPWNGSSVSSEPSMFLREILAVCNPHEGLVDNARPKAVGDARRSGPTSCGSGGGGVGSLGGGVGSRFFLIGYFLGSSFGAGASFSLASRDLLKRSSALRDPLTNGDSDKSAAAAALLRRSSASLASLEDPPSNFGIGLSGSFGTR